MSQIFALVARFFGKQQQKLLRFLHLLSNEVKLIEELVFLLPCMEEAKIDIEMNVAPLGQDSPDAKLPEKQIEFEELSYACVSLAQSLLVLLQEAALKSLEKFEKQHPEVEVAQLRSGLQSALIPLKDGATSMSSMIARIKIQVADAPSCSHSELPSETTKAISYPILGGKRVATYDPFSDPPLKKQETTTSQMFSGI
jgi:hypothetical protein